MGGGSKTSPVLPPTALPFFPPAAKLNAFPSKDGCCLPAAPHQEEPCLPTGRETGPGWAYMAKLGMLRRAHSEEPGG